MPIPENHFEATPPFHTGEYKRSLPANGLENSLKLLLTDANDTGRMEKIAMDRRKDRFDFKKISHAKDWPQSGDSPCRNCNPDPAKSGSAEDFFERSAIDI